MDCENMKKNLTAICDDLGRFGSMEILSRSGRSVYVIWTFWDKENKLIASLRHNYFLESENVDDLAILDLVKNQISKYRIGRRRLFSNVEFT